MASWLKKDEVEKTSCVKKFLNRTVVIKGNKTIMGSGAMKLGQVNAIWDDYKRT